MSEPLFLAKLSDATRLLAECRSLDELKNLHDLAEATRHYARMRQLGLEAVNHATEIKLRAERLMGEFLATMPKHTGGRPSGQTPTDMDRGFETVPPTLAEIGISYKESSRYQTIASLPEEVFEAHIEETKAQGEELTSAGVYREAIVHQALVNGSPLETPLPDAPVVRPMERWIALVKELWIIIGSVENAGGPAAMSEAWSDAGRESLLQDLDEVIVYLQDAAAKIRAAVGVIDLVGTGESS